MRFHRWQLAVPCLLSLVLLAGVGCRSPAPAAGSAPGNPEASSAPVSGGAPAAAPAPTERLRVAWVSAAGGYLSLWVAQDMGLFRQRGLEAELVYTSGAQAVQALLAREVDVAFTDGAAVVRSALAGGDTVSVGTINNTFSFKLLAQRGMQRPDDLRGKRLGITRTGNSTDFAARYMLRPYGLVPDVDVTLIQAGDTASIVEALIAGGLDAGLTGEPTAYVGMQHGLVNLLDLGAIGVEYPLTTFGVLRPAVRDQAAALRAFVGGMVDGVAWMGHHRPESIEILAKYTKIDDPGALDAAYEDTVRRSQRTPYPTIGAIVTVLESIRLEEPRAADANPADFIDDQFVRELDESGYIRKLYEQ
jgi:ABC-type nitrate/sulfonate/bicarbonate transport system substrate-binding protein